MRARATVARSSHLGPCKACEGSHDDILEMLVCQADARLDDVLDDCPSWDPQGTDEPLLDPHLPTRLRQRAWRRARTAVLERDALTCQDCGKDLAMFPSWYSEVHHVRPRTRGGSDHPRNLKTLCLECHGRYTDALATELGRTYQHRSSGSRAQNRIFDFKD